MEYLDMKYVPELVYFEETVQDERIIEDEAGFYFQSWSEEFQPIAQRVAEAYLDSIGKMEAEMSGEDASVVDALVFTEIESEIGDDLVLSIDN